MGIIVEYDKEGKIKSHVRDKHLVATPEEKVRQEFICRLVNEYGYDIKQIGEEVPIPAGKGNVRADIVVWRKIEDNKNTSIPPLIVVECKADYIHISEKDYTQGESYARILGAKFFVTHNNYETRFWGILKDKGLGCRQEVLNIPSNGADEKTIEQLYKDLLVFKEDEFANMLHKCHNIIRNIEKLDPAAAFDEIAKILFMKVYVERMLLKGQNKKFNQEYIKEAIREYNANPIESYFDGAKKEFAKDKIFKKDEKINLKEHTILKIIEELERYNLSLTSADVKGIAFERFLGRTFRGEIGQFFTPRSVVEFMVDMIDPKEGEISCDPASGSGGFLIRIFSKVREIIQKDIKNQYEAWKTNNIKDPKNPTDEEAKKLTQKFEELQKELSLENKNSRIYNLSNFCIYGVDANDRMARTSKMNMIMHGDGHSGIHHHNGLLNVNGVVENQFDIILTNPPFGSQVEESDVIQESDTWLTRTSQGELIAKEGYEEYIKQYYDLYGEERYKTTQLKIIDNIGKPIASLFELKPNLKSDKTEHLFINRCIDLLKPNGRLGIVLPEGVFNTPNAEYVRKFVEGRAFLRAVISLPIETFLSSKASVKCSILFIQKFDEASQQKWNDLITKHTKDLKIKHKKTIDNLNEIIKYRKSKNEQTPLYTSDDKKQARKDLKDLEAQIVEEAYQNTKNDFDYPVFMAEAEAVGITSTGETGEGVKNELMDIIEKDENTGEEKVIEKGINTCFEEFLKEKNIVWGKNE